MENTPKNPSIFFERTVVLQKRKIKNQRIMIARWERIYSREVFKTRVWDAFVFLVRVLVNKIRKKQNVR